MLIIIFYFSHDSKKNYSKNCELQYNVQASLAYTFYNLINKYITQDYTYLSLYKLLLLIINSYPINLIFCSNIIFDEIYNMNSLNYLKKFKTKPKIIELTAQVQSKIGLQINLIQFFNYFDFAYHVSV